MSVGLRRENRFDDGFDGFHSFTVVLDLPVSDFGLDREGAFVEVVFDFVESVESVVVYYSSRCVDKAEHDISHVVVIDHYSIEEVNIPTAHFDDLVVGENKVSGSEAVGDDEVVGVIGVHFVTSKVEPRLRVLRTEPALHL